MSRISNIKTKQELVTMQINKLFLIIISLNLTILGYNPEHVQKLKDAHLTGKVICKNCDFSSPDPSDRLNLQGYILPGCDLEGSNFEGSNLSGTQFPGSNFSRANLQKTVFSSSHLQNCNFSYVNANEALFVNTRLNYSEFLNAILAKTNFTYANLWYTNFNGAHFDDTIFNHSDLLHAVLTDSTGGILTDDRTSFCCTTLADRSIRSEQNGLCGLIQMQTCSQDPI
jgi:uncharacterized protein YjbI with pentapeptide repeats